MTNSLYALSVSIALAGVAFCAFGHPLVTVILMPLSAIPWNIGFLMERRR